MEEPNWTSSAAMRTPALWLLALATGMMFFMHAGSNTHAAAFFQDQGLGAVTAGVSISLNAIFLGISSLFWGRIVEKRAGAVCDGGGCAEFGGRSVPCSR